MPTARQTIAPSDRQVSFYNTLAAERNLPTIEAFAPGTSRRDASAAIEQLMAIPRPSRETAAPSEPTGEPMAFPSADNRAGRMLRAGSIEATVTLADGRHATVTVRTRKRSGRGWTNGALGEDGARTTISILGQRVGWINVDGDRLDVTIRTRRSDFATAIREVIAYAAGQATNYRVQEASRCGRCFRVLTDPVSIDRGIGPECFGRDTGSQHVAAERAANGTAVVREPRSTTSDHPGESPNEYMIRIEREALAAEARMNALVARGDREDSIRAASTEMAEERGLSVDAALDILGVNADGSPRRPAPSLVELAERATAPRQTEARPADRNIERAREIIAEALDAYCEDTDRDFAMRIFKQLAAR
jgi:hypothetical protein